jgi:pimeloyl-ACP methyl ester carboxylesterase
MVRRNTMSGDTRDAPTGFRKGKESTMKEIGRLFFFGILAAGLVCSTHPAFAQAARQMVERPGVAIEVFIEGQGPTVVMIPSLGRGAEDFADLARRVAAAGYRVLRPQPRGIAGSRGPLGGISLREIAADAAAVIETLKGEPAFVVGHAFGNRVARMLASDRPELVRAVLLLAAGGKAPMDPAIRDSLARCFDLALPEPERLEHVRRAFFAPGHDPSVWKGGWYPQVAEAQSRATLATPLESWWRGGRAPILVVQPMQDTVATPVNARMLKEEFKERITVVEIEDAGHALLPEQPEAVARAVIGYLRKQ